MSASTEVDNDRTRTGQENAQAKKERSARLRHLLITLAAFIALIAAVFALDEALKGATGQYHLLKDYQRSR